MLIQLSPDPPLNPPTVGAAGAASIESPPLTQLSVPAKAEFEPAAALHQRYDLAVKTVAHSFLVGIDAKPGWLETLGIESSPLYPSQVLISISHARRLVRTSIRNLCQPPEGPLQELYADTLTSTFLVDGLAAESRAASCKILKMAATFALQDRGSFSFLMSALASELKHAPLNLPQSELAHVVDAVTTGAHQFAGTYRDRLLHPLTTSRARFVLAALRPST